jgi:hypothetical protein
MSSSTTSSNYPEHEKLREIASSSQVIGEFLDWLGSRPENFEAKNPHNHGPIHLSQYRLITHHYTGPGRKSIYDVDSKEPNYHDEDNWEELPKDEWERSDAVDDARVRIEDLLAEFFGIDQKKLEAEKDAMLEEQRKLNAKHAKK